MLAFVAPGPFNLGSLAAADASPSASLLFLLADYTRSVTLKHVKRGFAYLCRYATTLLLVPLAGILAVSALVHSPV